MFLGKNLAQYIRKLTIVNISQDVTIIGDLFLKDCKRLTYLDLSSLSQLTQIGYCFLYTCSGLLYLYFSSLWQVKQIGGYFLLNCTGLEASNQIKLSTYNPILRFNLEETFPQRTNIGKAIREIYVEGYVPFYKLIKSARNN